jgi:WD40 repeat protein
VLSVSNEARLSPAEQGLRKVTECKCSSSRVFNVAWSPHGRELFFAAGDGGGIWDPGTGELKRMWSSIRRGPVQSISFKPDGSQVCLTKYWAESLIRSTRTGKSLQTFFPPNARTQGTNDCAWSPDGKWLAIPFDYGIWIWRTSPWQHVATIDRRPEEYGSRYWCVAWSPDSRLIAGGTGVGLTVWHVGEQRKLYQTHAGFIRTALEWSADGRLLLAGTSSGELVFFRAADGKVIRRSRGHKSPITGAQWSANGRRVASVSHDGTVKIWDAATGVNLVTLRVEGTLVNGLAWNSDGQLACACEDGALRIWGSPGMRQASQKATHLETGVLASSSSTKHL